MIGHISSSSSSSACARVRVSVYSRVFRGPGLPGFIPNPTQVRRRLLSNTLRHTVHYTRLQPPVHSATLGHTSWTVAVCFRSTKSGPQAS